jgi:hypothetical protein
MAEVITYTFQDFENTLMSKGVDGLSKNKNKEAFSDIKKIWDLITGTATDVTSDPSSWTKFQMGVRTITNHEKNNFNAITLIVETYTEETKRNIWQGLVNRKLKSIFSNSQITMKNPITGSKNSQATIIELKTYVVGGLKNKPRSEPIKIYLVFKDPVAKVVKTKTGLDILVVPAKMGVVGKWMTPQDMAVELKKYFTDIIYQKKPLPQEYIDQFHNIIDESLNLETTINYGVKQSKYMAFFAEVLSAMKLAVLLQNPDSTAAKPVIAAIKFNENKKYMEILKKNKRNIKIKLPIEQNYSLLDYFVSYNGTEDEESALKVSVKSKLSSSAKEGKEATGDTNTIKFQDVFDKLPVNVEQWFNEFKKMNSSQLANQQYGPKVIAYTAVDASNNSGQGAIFPIQALGKLLSDTKTKSNQYKQILPALERLGQKRTDLTETLKKLKPRTGTVSYSKDRVVQAYNNAFIEVGSKIGSTYKYQQPISAIKISDDDKYIVENTIGEIMITTKYKTAGLVDKNILNLVIMSEKIIMASATEESFAKYNFYQMFFDKVIREKGLIYGIPTRLGPDKLILKFYGLNNWESKYKSFVKGIEQSNLWIGVRGKASTNSDPSKWGGTLGLSV